MANLGRFGRWLLIGGAGFGVLAVALLGFGYGWAQSETGRAWIVRQVSGALSTPGVSKVTIGRLEGSLPHALWIRDVAVADSDGTWLEVRSIAVDWRPWALTQGLVEVTDLAIEDLRVLRAPAGVDDDTPAAGPPSLPVRVRVRRLEIANLELGPELLGTPARLAVAGGAQADEDGAVRAHLNITRTDGVEGRAEVRAAYRPGDDSLELTLGVSEPAGGLLARALAIEALPALQADLAGSGPLSDWRGDFTASFEDLASLDLDIGLSRGTGIAFTLAGSGENLHPATELPWTLLEGRIALAVEGAWQDDGVLNLARLEARTEALDLALDGRLDTTAATLKAQARAVLGDPSLLEGVLGGARVSDLTLALAAEGPLMQPDLHLEASATGLVLPEAEAAGLQVEVTFQPDGPLGPGTLAGALSAAGRIETLALPGLPELAPLLDGDLNWRFSGHVDLDKQQVSAEALSLAMDTARISGSGVALLPEGRIDARVELAVDELSRLAELTGLDLRGGLTLGGPLTIEQDGEQGGARVAADLGGALKGAGFGISGLDEILAGDVELAAKLAWNETGLDLTEISVKSALADLTAEARFDPDFTQVEAAYSLNVAEAAALAPALGIGISGEARLEGRADGAIGDPLLSGRVDLASLSHQGFALTDLIADARIETAVSQPSGHLAASAGTPIGPVSLETTFAAAAENLVLSGLHLASREATVDGDARIPLDGGPPAADLRFRVPDLAPWLPLAGLTGSGSGAGTLSLAAEDGRETAALSAQVDGLDLRPGDGPPIGVDAVSVRLRVTDPLAQPNATLNLEASGIAMDELRLDRLSADGRGNLEAVDLTIGATGSWRGPLEIEAAGRIGRAGDTTTLDLTALEARVLGEPLRLQAPARLSATAETFGVENLRLTYGTAQLRMDGRLSPAEIAVSLVAEEVPGPLLAPLWPAEVSGTLAAEARIEGPRAAPAGQLALGVTDIRVAGLDEVPPLAVSLTGDWADGRLALNGVVQGASDADARLSAEFPLRLEPDSLSVSMPADEPIAADLAWRGEIARLAELAPLSDHVLTGAADVRLEAAGTLAQLRLAGGLSISGGRYENLVTGTLLENLALTIALDGEEARITELEADDGRGGRLSADGSARIDPASGFPFHLETTLEKLFLVRRDEATASAGGRLSLEGTLKRADLTGRIETETVELRVLDRLPAEVAELDVVELDADGAPPSDAAEPKSGAFELGLDLVLDMPRKVFVRGRGLDSEWAGHLEITGTADDPRIAGQLSLVRGQISLVGKLFELDRGVITFPEGDEIIPHVDVAAVNTGQSLTTTVRVVGPATNPKIELSSVPELPPDEILAQALFDKSSGQLDAVQGAQLAAAVAQLSGTGGSGAGLLGTVRATLGVDVLRVETVETEGGTAPAATAGKYLSDEIYLGVTQGADVETGSVGVEVELTPNISVESDVRQTGESSVGIKLKFDY